MLAQSGARAKFVGKRGVGSLPKNETVLFETMRADELR
jgi:hypothetical protein